MIKFLNCLNACVCKELLDDNTLYTIVFLENDDRVEINKEIFEAVENNDEDLFIKLLVKECDIDLELSFGQNSKGKFISVYNMEINNILLDLEKESFFYILNKLEEAN